MGGPPLPPDNIWTAAQLNRGYDFYLQPSVMPASAPTSQPEAAAHRGSKLATVEDVGRGALRVLWSMNRQFYAGLPGVLKKRSKMVLGFCYYFKAINSGNPPKKKQYDRTLPVGPPIDSAPMGPEEQRAILRAFAGDTVRQQASVRQMVRLLSTMPISSDIWAATDPDALFLHKVPNERNVYRVGGFETPHDNSPEVRLPGPSASAVFCTDRKGICGPKALTDSVREQIQAASPGFYKKNKIGSKTLRLRVPHNYRVIESLKMLVGLRPGSNAYGTFHRRGGAILKGAPILQQMKQIIRYIRGSQRSLSGASGLTSFQIVREGRHMNGLAFPSSFAAARERMFEMILSQHQCIFLRRAILGRQKIVKHCSVCFAAGSSPSPTCPVCGGAQFTGPGETMQQSRRRALKSIYKRAVRDKHQAARALADDELLLLAQQPPEASSAYLHDVATQSTCYVVHPASSTAGRNHNFAPNAYSYATRILMSVVCSLELEILHMLNAWSVVCDSAFEAPDNKRLWVVSAGNRVKVLREFVLFHTYRAFPILSKNKHAAAPGPVPSDGRARAAVVRPVAGRHARLQGQGVGAAVAEPLLHGAGAAALEAIATPSTKLMLDACCTSLFLEKKKKKF